MTKCNSVTIIFSRIFLCGIFHLTVNTNTLKSRGVGRGSGKKRLKRLHLLMFQFHSNR